MSFLHLVEKLLITLTLEICLLATCLFGDTIISILSPTRSNEPDLLWMRAVVDSATHGFVAFFSWAIVELTSLGDINAITFINCGICAGLAVMVDLDHFMAARSFHIKDAMNLSNRPLFHATTVIPTIFFLLIICGQVLKSNRLKYLSFIFVLSWSSHHVRDATRRGLWLPPFASSPPIPYAMYVFLIMFLPLCVRGVIKFLGVWEIL